MNTSLDDYGYREQKKPRLREAERKQRAKIAKLKNEEEQGYGTDGEQR